MQNRRRIFDSLNRRPDIAFIDQSVIHQKSELIARRIVFEQTIVWPARRDPVQIIEQRATHIRRNKKVAVIGEGVLTEADLANSRLADYPEHP
jgi:hypothetical protein